MVGPPVAFLFLSGFAGEVAGGEFSLVQPAGGDTFLLSPKKVSKKCD